jgi:hypothetical protein
VYADGLAFAHSCVTKAEAQFHQVAHYAVWRAVGAQRPPEIWLRLLDLLIRTAGPGDLRALERAPRDR